MRFENKVAIVTRAASSIGRASIQVGKSRLLVAAESVQDLNIRLVDARHIAGGRVGRIAGSVVEPDIENLVHLKIVCADQVSVLHLPA